MKPFYGNDKDFKVNDQVKFWLISCNWQFWYQASRTTSFPVIYITIMQVLAGAILTINIMIQNLHGKSPSKPVPRILKCCTGKTNIVHVDVSPYYKNSEKMTRFNETRINPWHEVSSSLDSILFVVSLTFVIATSVTFLLIGYLNI